MKFVFREPSDEVGTGTIFLFNLSKAEYVILMQEINMTMGFLHGEKKKE